MKRLFDVILLILIIAIAIIVGAISIEFNKRQKNEKKVSEIVTIVENRKIENKNDNIKDEFMKIEGYDIYGIIEIPKIKIKYPIIKYNTDADLKISITKFAGGKINDIGNYTLAGHNNSDGTMFGKTKKLKNGDIIKLTDLNHNTVEYEVFEVYTTDPNDVECTKCVNDKTREVTLITCKNGRKNRLITKAREVIK